MDGALNSAPNRKGKNYAYHSTTIHGYCASQSVCLDANWNPCHALQRTRNRAGFYSYDNIWYCRFYNRSYKGIKIMDDFDLDMLEAELDNLTAEQQAELEAEFEALRNSDDWEKPF